MSSTVYEGNFNTGEFEFFVHGETVLSVNLTELNQNSANFQSLLSGNINRAIERAARLGYLKAKEDMLRTLEQEIN